MGTLIPSTGHPRPGDTPGLFISYPNLLPSYTMRRAYLPGLLPLIIALSIGAGCAQQIPPVSLHPLPSAPAPGSAPMLTVFPLEDQRPPEQHKGKTPPLVILGVWNSRMGDYVTSDRAFLGDLSGSVSEAVAFALGGGRFGDARVIPQASSGASSAAAQCLAAGTRYVATGTILDLYATQHESTYLFLVYGFVVYAGGWNHKLSDPLGVARVQIQVWDCETGQTIFERDLRSENRFSKIPLSQAANLALTDVLQKLHNEVLPLAPSPAPTPEEHPLEGKRHL
jgi:hypothetical protein